IKSARFDENLNFLRNATLKIYDRIYQHGVINKPKSSIADPFLSFRKRDTYEIIVKKESVWDMAEVQNYINQECAKLPGGSAKLAKEILIKLCKPNYIANETLHQQEKEAILNSVSKFYGKVKKNEVIVLKGQTITKEIADKIRSLVRTKKQTEGAYSTWLRLVGQLMMITLLTLIFVLFLRINRKEIFFRNRKLSFLLILHFFMTVVIVTVMQIGEHIKSDFDVNYHLIVPVCMVPIVITIFFDDRIGFVSNVLVAILAAYVTPNSFEFFFIQMCAGSVAVYNLTVLRNRSQFFETVGLVFITYCLAYLSYHFFLKGSLESLNYRNIAMFLINVLFTMATYPLIYFFEKLFGFSSDLTYIELLDTNHPILRELAMKAPGTFQHSLQVANLAEAAANKIDGHGLLVRVGAMFHDIGKIYHPQ
ncbi:MAG: HDIG domain-containing protein, partial [Bacteroidia bacterium]|nr:HDIG domain-containing protein [Bacteroidia bacterium]